MQDKHDRQLSRCRTVSGFGLPPCSSISRNQIDAGRAGDSFSSRGQYVSWTSVGAEAVMHAGFEDCICLGQFRDCEAVQR